MYRASKGLLPPQKRSYLTAKGNRDTRICCQLSYSVTLEIRGKEWQWTRCQVYRVFATDDGSWKTKGWGLITFFWNMCNNGGIRPQVRTPFVMKYPPFNLPTPCMDAAVCRGDVAKTNSYVVANPGVLNDVLRRILVGLFMGLFTAYFAWPVGRYACW